MVIDEIAALCAHHQIPFDPRATCNQMLDLLDQKTGLDTTGGEGENIFAGRRVEYREGYPMLDRQVPPRRYPNAVGRRVLIHTGAVNQAHRKYMFLGALADEPATGGKGYADASAKYYQKVGFDSGVLSEREAVIKWLEDWSVEPSLMRQLARRIKEGAHVSGTN